MSAWAPTLLDDLGISGTPGRPPPPEPRRAARAPVEEDEGSHPSSRITRITNIHLLRKGTLVNEDLWICGGRVIDPATLGGRAAAEVVDGKGAVCAPGLIDVQINGAFGIDFTTPTLTGAEVDTICRGVLAHGCTSLCPTVITSSPEMYRAVLPLLRRREGDPERGACILGAHVEGPFLSDQKYGAHDKRYCAVPSKGFEDVVRVYGAMDCIAMVTMAPELEGAYAAVEGLAARGLRVSMGHSNATLAEAERALPHGANMVTHMFNAMRSFQHRDPGLVGLLGSRYPQRPYWGIIADGLHAHPASVRMAYQSHPRGCVLVTDAMEAMGMPPGRYKLAGREVNVELKAVRGGLGVGEVGFAHCARLVGTDTLAGAVPTLIECVRNLCTFTGCSFVRALEAASLHPAQMLGIEHLKGTLEPGADADFVLLTHPGDRPPAEALQVISTWVGGQPAYIAPEEPPQSLGFAVSDGRRSRL
eukprot:Hpha_TRINITY_DN14022_c0_g2::TRINITY_DN14022_c0_g2_i1::g.44154::m.44154/K01443/nagA, AMDHD2; N-acetylglucosamine-6-phosphate deacetylase